MTDRSTKDRSAREDRPGGRDAADRPEGDVEDPSAGASADRPGGDAADRLEGDAPTTVDKPWGREIWYAHTDRYAGKVLEVDAGHRLSLQKHRVKHETLYLQSGRMRFTLGERDFDWLPGHRVVIPPDTVHRMEALEDSVILEVSTPELEDVVRLEDDYRRA